MRTDGRDEFYSCFSQFLDRAQKDTLKYIYQHRGRFWGFVIQVMLKYFHLKMKKFMYVTC